MKKLLLVLALVASFASCSAIRDVGREVCKGSDQIATKADSLLGQIPIVGDLIGDVVALIIRGGCKVLTVPTEAVGDAGDAVDSLLGGDDAAGVRDGEERGDDHEERGEGDGGSG